MTFVHPWLLLGVAAAFIPLLIHLFDRRRPRPQPFPPLSFVLRSQRRTASRLRLRRLILYALRTFLFVAFPVALARPEWRRQDIAPTIARGPAATAVLLDASLSMRYRDGEPLFERGRNEARAVLTTLQASEAAALLICGLLPPSRRAPTLDRRALLAELDGAAPSFAAVDMTRCLEAAARSLEESPLPKKRIVVISDFTARAFPAGAVLPTVIGPDNKPVRPEVVLRDVVPGKTTLPNHALAGLKIQPAPHAGPRAFQLTFSVKNYGPTPLHDLNVQLKAGDAVVARGFVEVPPGGTVEKVFTHRFEVAGLVQGEVSLDPDNLPEDDHQAFVLQIPAEQKALLVNGAPSALRHRDEAFFAEAALRASSSMVQLTVRDAEAAWREDFSHYALVLLLNVEAPPPEVASRLQRFVEAGGGLFLAMGDRVQPDLYDTRLGALLPRPLRVLKTASRPGQTEGAAKLGEVNERHPVFALFTGSAEEGLLSARFYRYFLLEPQAPGTGAEVLAAFDDGAPALVASRYGKGRVALWTSTVDRDWTDLPIRTAFLPLMQRLCAHLSGALEEREPVRAQVGERLTLPAVQGRAAVRMRSPSGGELPLGAQPSGESLTPPLPEPGIYWPLDASGSPLVGLTFAAALDPSESDLSRTPPEAFSRAWGEDVVVASSRSPERAPVPLWTWLLLAAAFALFAEGLILRRT